nr:MAG TPA: hypothetical protein [Caudoviricetes sp.]
MAGRTMMTSHLRMSYSLSGIFRAYETFSVK